MSGSGRVGGTQFDHYVIEGVTSDVVAAKARTKTRCPDCHMWYPDTKEMRAKHATECEPLITTKLG